MSHPQEWFSSILRQINHKILTSLTYARVNALTVVCADRCEDRGLEGAVWGGECACAGALVLGGEGEFKHGDDYNLALPHITPMGNHRAKFTKSAEVVSL